jgi:Ca2+-binding EF-hand superfamily protein
MAAAASSASVQPSTQAALKAALTAAQVEELDGLFQVFELKAGCIHCSDLSIAFQMLGTQLTKEQVQAFITLYSSDGKHFSKEEFFEIAGEVILSKEENDKEKKLDKAYDLFDLHGSGSVSAKQLHRVLAQLNQVTERAQAGGTIDDISEESLDALIRDLDEDGLGITKHMFIDMLKDSPSIL